jgi:hypothetical protein
MAASVPPGSYPLTGKGNGFIEIGFTFQEAIAS